MYYIFSVNEDLRFSLHLFHQEILALSRLEDMAKEAGEVLTPNRSLLIRSAILLVAEHISPEQLADKVKILKARDGRKHRWEKVQSQSQPPKSIEEGEKGKN